MNASARELALLAHAKSRALILGKAQQIRISLGLKPSPHLVPPLILKFTDRIDFVTAQPN